MWDFWSWGTKPIVINRIFTAPFKILPSYRPTIITAAASERGQSDRLTFRVVVVIENLARPTSYRLLYSFYASRLPCYRQSPSMERLFPPVSHPTTIVCRNRSLHFHVRSVYIVGRRLTWPRMTSHHTRRTTTICCSVVAQAQSQKTSTTFRILPCVVSVSSRHRLTDDTYHDNGGELCESTERARAGDILID